MDQLILLCTNCNSAQIIKGAEVIQMALSKNGKHCSKCKYAIHFKNLLIGNCEECNLAHATDENWDANRAYSTDGSLNPNSCKCIDCGGKVLLKPRKNEVEPKGPENLNNEIICPSCSARFNINLGLLKNTEGVKRTECPKCKNEIKFRLNKEKDYYQVVLIPEQEKFDLEQTRIVKSINQQGDGDMHTTIIKDQRNVAVLKVWGEETDYQEITLCNGDNLLGRFPDEMKYRIDTQDLYMSRKHFIIHVISDANNNTPMFKISHVGSENGTYVNGAKIQNQTSLNETDLISFGKDNWARLKILQKKQ